MAPTKLNKTTISALVGIVIIFVLWSWSDLSAMANATAKQYATKLSSGHQPEIPGSGANHPIPASKASKGEGKKRPVAASKGHRPSFYDIAAKYGTDKVMQHHYQYLYEKYLEPLRDHPLKMLEIGLGCDMSYGPGASYYTWLEYLPNVELYYIEYDAECARKWANKTTGATLFVGDQADRPFLDKFIRETGGGFDIIIDDGGHRMKQQIVSLEVLYGAVVSGGIYFVEDLATSYHEAYGGGPQKHTMMDMIKELLDDLNIQIIGSPKLKNPVGAQMRSLECGEEICAFFKM